MSRLRDVKACWKIILKMTNIIYGVDVDGVVTPLMARDALETVFLPGAL